MTGRVPLLLCLLVACTEPEPAVVRPVLGPSWAEARVGDEVTLSSRSRRGERRTEELLRLTVVKRSEKTVFVEASLGGVSRLVEVSLTGAAPRPLEGELQKYELPNGQVLPCHLVQSSSGRGYYNQTRHCRSPAPPLYLTGGLVEWSSVDANASLSSGRGSSLRLVSLSRGRLARVDPTSVLLFEPTSVRREGGSTKVLRSVVRQDEVLTTECWSISGYQPGAEELDGEWIRCRAPTSSPLVEAILHALQQT